MHALINDLWLIQLRVTVSVIRLLNLRDVNGALYDSVRRYAVDCGLLTVECRLLNEIDFAVILLHHRILILGCKMHRKSKTIHFGRL